MEDSSGKSCMPSKLAGDIAHRGGGMKKLVFLILVLVVLSAACGSSSEVDPAEVEKACTEAGGMYVAEHVECENISEQTCTDMGGTFDECASPCRHEPEDVVCVTMCVPLCTFD
jgi:hypothetical protein